MSRTTAFEFEIPDNMSHDEQWPYIFSQMFMHFDNDCVWGSGSPSYAKEIAVNVVEAVCKENIRSMKSMMRMEAR